MLFTNTGFNPDWINHLSYVWNQNLAIRANHHPSFFLNSFYSVFYPKFAFYGGTLYAITGTISLLSGNAPVETYVAAYLVAFGAAYGGWFWLARMAGLRGWQTHAPGLIFVTSAYYLTLIYARGDLPEFVGVSTIPLLLASGLSVLRADRLHMWPALALACSTIVFFGAHGLTMLWGSTTIALVGAAALVCIPETRKWLTRRGLARVAGLTIPALLVNAWYLLPAIAYEAHTRTSLVFAHWRETLTRDLFIVAAKHLFTLSRTSPLDPKGVFDVALPLLVIIWGSVSLVVFLRRGLRDSWVKMLLICIGATVAMGVTMAHSSIVFALPRLYAMLQFSYRLESYVLLGISGAVLACLVLAQMGTERERLWAWALVPILAVGVVAAIRQTAAYTKYEDRYEAVAPHEKPRPGGEEGLIDFTDGSLPLEGGQQLPEMHLTAAAARDEHASLEVHLPPGQLVYSNIGGGPELVHVTGAKIVGLDVQGGDVLEIGPSIPSAGGSSGSRWTEVVSVSPQNSLPVVLGRLLTWAGIAFLLGGFAVLSVRRRQARPI